MRWVHRSLHGYKRLYSAAPQSTSVSTVASSISDTAASHAPQDLQLLVPLLPRAQPLSDLHLRCERAAEVRVLDRSQPGPVKPSPGLPP
jgi:hypothetical protein